MVCLFEALHLADITTWYYYHHYFYFHFYFYCSFHFCLFEATHYCWYFTTTPTTLCLILHFKWFACLERFTWLTTPGSPLPPLLRESVPLPLKHFLLKNTSKYRTRKKLCLFLFTARSKDLYDVIATATCIFATFRQQSSWSKTHRSVIQWLFRWKRLKLILIGFFHGSWIVITQTKSLAYIFFML